MDMFGSIGRLLARVKAQPLLNAIDRVFTSVSHPPLPPSEAIIYPYSVPDYSDLLGNALKVEGGNGILEHVQTCLKSTFMVEMCRIDMPVAEIDRVSATKGYSGRFEVIDDFIAYLATTAANMKAAGQTFTPIGWSTPADYLNNLEHLKRNTGIDYRVELYSGAYKLHSAHYQNPPKPIITLSNDGGGHHGFAAFFQARNDQIDDILPGNLRVVYLDPTHSQYLRDRYHVILVPTGHFFRILTASRANQEGTYRFPCVHQTAPEPWQDHTVIYLPKSDSIATIAANALLDKGEPHGILDLGAEWERIESFQICPEYLQKKLSSRFHICGIPALKQPSESLVS